MTVPRALHTATLLNNGKVLVAGGANSTGAILSSAELFDPVTGKWSSAGTMAVLRAQFTATLLPSGKVLVAGGCHGQYCWTRINGAELYDPAANTWSATGNLNDGTAGHAAVLLASGKVLLAGGQDASALQTRSELYDPSTGAWSLTGSLHVSRYLDTDILLSSGKVLIAGTVNGLINQSSEVYDPVAGTWSYSGNLNTLCAYPPLLMLRTGKALIVAGLGRKLGGRSFAIAGAELWDPATGVWTITGSLIKARYYHTATLLSNGQVLAAGGYRSAGIIATAELYQP